MTDESKNITKMPVKELAKKIICDGHLFLSIGGRKFYLMKPGIFVDPSFIKKHAVNNQVFDYEAVTDSEVKEKFKSLLKELKYLQFEKDLREKCIEFLDYFHETFTGDTHFLSFASACHEELCNIPYDDQLRMAETDLHLFRKALYSSAFAVITGMANDFYHFLMLKDFYNLTFALDMGLCESSYSYFVAQACNEENRNPGTGKQLLINEKASEMEVRVFHEHPLKSHDYVKESHFLAFPELAEITLYQHELTEGNGFPRGVRKGQISSWEAIVIFSDSLVEILPDYNFETNVIEYLTNFSSQKLKDLPVGKVFKKLCLAFEHLRMLKETGS